MMIVVVRTPAGDSPMYLKPSLSIGELASAIEEKFGILRQNQVLAVEEDPGGEDGIQFVEEIEEEDGSTHAAAGEATDTAESSSEDEKDPYWTFAEKKKVIDYRTAHPKQKFSTLQHQFHRLKERQFYKFKIQVAAGGTTKEKWQFVEQEVKRKFDDARNDMLPIHDVDIRKWALDAASNHRLSTTISHGWIDKFKNKYGIVSRRVSKVWNKAKLQRADETKAAAGKFRQEVQAKLPHNDHDMIMNTDQSGFQYEFFSTRTLSYKGEHQTPIATRSMNKTTHSYTIQPTLSLSGKLQSPLYLCTQEDGGRMGDIVEATYLRPPNVSVTCSASGKLTTSHCTYYVENVLKPMLTGDSVLLLDSWGGQQSDVCFASIDARGFKCERMCIPAGATPTTQPLDVFYNRQWKGVVRKFYDYVQVQRLETVNLYQRDNIIKMQSLVHHLFSHDRFAPMGQYAFFASGLRPDRPARFETPAAVLFPSDLSKCDHCPKKAFIRCVYCNGNLCFNEFFEAFHNHMGFVPPTKEAISAIRKAVIAARRGATAAEGAAPARGAKRGAAPARGAKKGVAPARGAKKGVAPARGASTARGASAARGAKRGGAVAVTTTQTGRGAKTTRGTTTTTRKRARKV